MHRRTIKCHTHRIAGKFKIQISGLQYDLWRTRGPRAVVIAFNYRRTITKTRRNLETARKKPNVNCCLSKTSGEHVRRHWNGQLRRAFSKIEKPPNTRYFTLFDGLQQ